MQVRIDISVVSCLVHSLFLIAVFLVIDTLGARPLISKHLFRIICSLLCGESCTPSKNTWNNLGKAEGEEPELY